VTIVSASKQRREGRDAPCLFDGASPKQQKINNNVQKVRGRYAAAAIWQNGST
jgi:hypothetical protein